jgi:hypothetical protein
MLKRIDEWLGCCHPGDVCVARWVSSCLLSWGEKKKEKTNRLTDGRGETQIVGRMDGRVNI